MLFSSFTDFKLLNKRKDSKMEPEIVGIHIFLCNHICIKKSYNLNLRWKEVIQQI